MTENELLDMETDEEGNKTEKEKLPTREERRKKKLEVEAQFKEMVRLRGLLKEFVDKEVIGGILPAYSVAEQLPSLLRAILKVYTSNTKEYKAYLEAKKIYEDTPMKDLRNL